MWTFGFSALLFGPIAILAALLRWRELEAEQGKIYTAFLLAACAGMAAFSADTFYDENVDPKWRLTLTAEDIRCMGWPRPIPWLYISSMSYKGTRVYPKLATLQLDPRLDPIIAQTITLDGFFYCRVIGLDTSATSVFREMEKYWKMEHGEI